MKTIVSGIQPTGNLTLGNYLGAIKQFVDLQNTLDDAVFYIFIADLHAITVPKVPSELRKNIKELAALYLAAGLNPEKVNLFIQSEVREHAELGYALQTITYIGELERMTQFKDKKVKQVNGVSTALLTYPVLMAGDILLYNADYVPVGVDQKQHLELTRDLAERFNNRYSETFKIPEPLLVKNGSKVMSLPDPTKKMSKSDPNEKSAIYILDPKEVIRKKIASAVTDSETCVKYDPVNKPGISNLLTIMSACTNRSIPELENEFKDSNYGTFKQAVADSVISVLEPIQNRFKEYINSSELDEILNKGRDNASFVANKMIKKVYRKIGLGRK